MNITPASQISYSSNSHDTWRFADQKAEEQALIEILKAKWKRYYLHNPTNRMAELDGYADDCKIANTRDLAMITFNFEDGEGVFMDEARTQWIIDMQKRTWMFAIKAWWEEGKETKHPHVHMVVKMKMGYSPAQIRQILYKGEARTWFGSPDFIWTVKHPRSWFDTGYNYDMSNDKVREGKRIIFARYDEFISWEKKISEKK